MSRPGRFQVVTTDAGFHVRVVGAQGEPVVAGEVLTDVRTAVDAIGVVCEAVDALRAHINSIEEVDERTAGSEDTGAAGVES
jgi:hypothetical protein